MNGFVLQILSLAALTRSHAVLALLMDDVGQLECDGKTAKKFPTAQRCSSSFIYVVAGLYRYRYNSSLNGTIESDAVELFLFGLIKCADKT